MPIISIIVPVYKVEDHLNRCVESVLAQTFSDFELILVDDGSPDGCPVLCDHWATQDTRIRVIHKENGGLSDARNVGFEASQGEWITFIDSDDYVHPAMIQALYDAVQAYGVKVSACGFVRTGGEPLEDSQDLTAKLWSAEDYYLQQYVVATVACCKLYHRSVVLPYPKGKLHEDEFVTYRILFDSERIAVLDAALYGYYQNPLGIMRSAQLHTKKALDKHDALLEQFLFMRGCINGKPEIFARNCYLNLCVSLYSIDRDCEAYCQLVDRAKLSYSLLSPYLNRYDRMYLYLLRIPGACNWIIKNDFEPVQNIIRRVLFWKYRS